MTGGGPLERRVEAPERTNGDGAREVRDSGLTVIRVGMGLALFLMLGALGAWAAAKLDPTGSLTLRGITTAVPAETLAVALGLVVLDYLLGGLRLHVWIRRVSPQTSWLVSLKTYLINLFAASISPMGSASAPAQVAALAQAGVPPARSLAALLINFVGLMAAFLVVGGASGLYLTSRADLTGSANTLLLSLLILITVVMLFMVVVVGNPGIGTALARRLVETGEHRRWRPVARFGRVLAKGVEEYRVALTLLKVGWYRPFVLATVLSAVMLLNKCLVGWVLARGLGFDGTYVDVAARQSLQWLLIYFSPSPGGSGVAEATVPAFLEGIVPSGHVLEFTVLWRVLTALLGAGLGGIVSVAAFTRRTKAAAPAAPPAVR